MWKHTIKTALSVFGIVSWILLFFLSWALFEIVRSPFSVNAYDVSHRLTSPDGKKTALLVREFAFDLNFRLFIMDDSYDRAPSDSKEALWSSRDYNPDPSINWHEDLEWSKDSSVIAVIIEGDYVFAYDFDLKKEYKDAGEIKQLLESNNIP